MDNEKFPWTMAIQGIPNPEYKNQSSGKPRRRVRLRCFGHSESPIKIGRKSDGIGMGELDSSSRRTVGAHGRPIYEIRSDLYDIVSVRGAGQMQVNKTIGVDADARRIESQRRKRNR